MWSDEKTEKYANEVLSGNCDIRAAHLAVQALYLLELKRNLQRKVDKLEEENNRLKKEQVWDKLKNASS